MLPLLVAIIKYFTLFEAKSFCSFIQYQIFGSYEERGREQEACPLLSSCLHSEVSVEAHTPVTPGTVSSH